MKEALSRSSSPLLDYNPFFLAHLPLQLTRYTSFQAGVTTQEKRNPGTQENSRKSDAYTHHARMKEKY
jgi:hypothetical protein